MARVAKLYVNHDASGLRVIAGRRSVSSNCRAGDVPDTGHTFYTGRKRAVKPSLWHIHDLRIREGAALVAGSLIILVVYLGSVLQSQRAGLPTG